MEKLKTFRWTTGLLIAGLGLILFAISCKREPLVSQTSTNTNITTYLDKNPDKYSEFRKILARSGTADFLQAYGTYTLFLPNNDAVKQYLQDMGKSSVDDISVEDLTNLVEFHVISDTISTRDFGDGKIGSLTMYGQYLTTGATIVNGQTSVRINRQANIVASNIRVGNGIIHEIDHVLTPATKTLAEAIEANPNFSIFTQAMKETGLYDSLKILPSANPDTTRAWLTVLVETDSVFKAAGFNTYADLKARFSKSGNPKNPTDSLHLFVDYHILSGVKYLADIGSATSHKTIAPSQIVNSSRAADKQVLINDITFNGTYEPGIELPRSKGDNSTSNGVYHVTAPYASSVGVTTGHYEIKLRKPTAVYWDVADFPEIRALGSIFRHTAVKKPFPKVAADAYPIAGWDWQHTEPATNSKYSMDYCTPGGAGAPSSNKSFVYGDYMHISLGVATAANPGSATNAWMYMQTPVIVKGRYKVWMCYERREQTGKWPTGRRTQCQVSIDGVALAKPFDFAEPPPVGSSAELESQGWKYYTTDPLRATAASPIPNVLVGKMVGIVDITSTNVHQIRLDVIQGNSNTDCLDMVHFIPVDAPSQILPRFRPDGTMDYTDVP